MIKKQYHLTENQIKKIENDAKKNQISPAEMLRRILDEHYSKNK